jgi:rhodanese-related sulfurtransferase
MSTKPHSALDHRRGVLIDTDRAWDERIIWGRSCPMERRPMETINRHQLKAKLDAGEDIKLVMTVGGWTFRAKHIPGSLSFPSPRCALQALHRDDEIILYSTSHHRQDTRAAFDALTAHGYRHVRCYLGGLVDWVDAGFPVEASTIDATAAQHWPHGHSPRGLGLDGGCPHCDNGWSGYGWPPADPADQLGAVGHQPQTPGRDAALVR